MTFQISDPKRLRPDIIRASIEQNKKTGPVLGSFVSETEFSLAIVTKLEKAFNKPGSPLTPKADITPLLLQLRNSWLNSI